MMRSKKVLSIIILFCGLILSTVSVSGQSEDPLPVITADNVSDLTPISTVESTYLGELAWSSNGDYIAVGTSHDGVNIFQADTLNEAPLQLAGGLDVLFHPTEAKFASDGAVWDIETQDIIFTYGESDFLQFSPDGQYLFTAIRTDENNDFTLWDVATGEIFQTFTVDMPQVLQSIVFSEDLSRFALIFGTPNAFIYPIIDGTAFIQVRDIATASLLTTINGIYRSWDDVTFANDGQYLVAENLSISYGGSRSYLVIWDIEAETAVREFDGFDQVVEVSPDGDWVLVIENVDRMILVATDTGQGTFLITSGLNIDIWGGYEQDPIRFTPDGRYLAIEYSRRVGGRGKHNQQMIDAQGGYETGIAIWETSPVTDVREPFALITQAEFRQGAFDISPDSQLVTTTSEETTIWDIETQSQLVTLPEAGRPHFTPNGDYLIIENVNEFGQRHVWELQSQTLVNEDGIPLNYGLSSPDGLQFARVISDTLYFADMLSGEETEVPVLDGYFGQVVEFDANNNLIVFQDGDLTVTDLNDQRELLKLNVVNRSARFLLSEDGSLLLVWMLTEQGSQEAIITIYHLRDDEVIGTQLDGTFSTNYITSFDVSHDSQYIIVTTTEYNANLTSYMLYDIETGTEIASWEQEQAYFSLETTFSTDMRYLVTVGEVRGGAIRENLAVMDIWEIEALLTESNPTPVSTVIMSQGGLPEVLDVSFTSDETQIMVSIDYPEYGDGPAIRDYRLTLLDWEAVLIAESESYANDIDSAIYLRGAYLPTFVPNSSLLLASRVINSAFGATLQLWDLDTEEVLINFEDYHSGIVSPDGSLLMALSNDGQMVAWEIGSLLDENPIPLVTFDSPNVSEIAFSPNGDRIYQQTTYGVITLAIAP